jgi:2-amino-4-hydroxy-6-hydroxymethyldihydropteridine diphosphokinase
MSSSNDEPESKPVRAALSLGSNMNAREQNILEAIHRLDSTEGVSIRSFSSLYESEPVGEGLTGSFINAAAIIETIHAARALLGICMELEKGAGRRREGFVHDRPLDIDILLYGDLVTDEDGLEIPHPRLAERAFVLLPLAEIGGDINVPPDGRSVEELLERCGGEWWVRFVSARRTIY